MKNKLKLLTTILVLFSFHSFAQHGHSINSNSIIHQQPRMNGAAHATINANTNGISHANSNSIFGKANRSRPEKQQEPKVNVRDNQPEKERRTDNDQAKEDKPGKSKKSK